MANSIDYLADVSFIYIYTTTSHIKTYSKSQTAKTLETNKRSDDIKGRAFPVSTVRRLPDS